MTIPYSIYKKQLTTRPCFCTGACQDGRGCPLNGFGRLEIGRIVLHVVGVGLQPWVCPKCGRVWGPGVPNCSDCNTKITEHEKSP